MMTRWLVTRPREEAERFADAMRDRGLDPVVAPILEIEPVDPGPIDLADVQAVLATSRNGIDAFARRVARRDLPVLAVGDATAELARALGFRTVASAAGDGDDLAELARARLDPAGGVLLHPSGEDVARDLTDLLAGFTVRRIVLYRARPAAELPPAAVAALADPGLAGVVFFSPRTAKVFATLAARVELTHRLAGLTAVCLSPAVAQALDPSPWRAVRIADRPDSPSLLARLSDFPAEQETRTANGMDPTPDKPGEAAAQGPESQQPDDVSAPSQAQPESPGAAGEPAAPHTEEILGVPAEGPLTPTERVIEAFGGIRPMAAKLTVPVTTVQGWKRRNAIPEQRHADILAAAKTHGIALDPAELARTRPATPEEGVPEPLDLSEPENPPGPPRVGPPTIPPPPPAEPPGNVARSAWTAAAVAVVAAAIAVTSPVWSPKLFGTSAPTPAPQGSPTLGDRVAFIEKRLADFPSGISEAIDGLGKRVEALEKPPGGPVDPAAIEKGRADLATRVDAIQQKLDQLAGTAPQPAQPPAQPQQPAQPEQPAPQPAAPAPAAPAATPEAVAALEARVAALESAQAAVKTLGDTVATLSSGSQANGSTLAALQQQVDAVKATVERLRNSDTGAQALSLAAGQLRSALDTGAPLDETLALLRGLAQNDPGLGNAVAALEPAAKGVPSRAALATGFVQAAEAARKAGQPESGDWVDRSLSVVQDLVTVRPAPGEVEGTDTNAVLARAEGRLQRGDLAGAVEAVKGLNGPAASALAAWRGQAEARLSAESALQSLSALAVQRLSAATGAASGDTQPPKAP
ncbi:MAG: uroporphyrinogen-III synthase [Inquilinus limosus]|uniref:Uroporphyrinogen-III synthase n=1 Tax=Inquilinus limosus TaxID=171674 RepID=A0A952FRW3_9PROT|nr:uroporphyrinogen-III synthase [Inquilinus limosus]